MAANSGNGCKGRTHQSDVEENLVVEEQLQGLITEVDLGDGRRSLGARLKPVSFVALALSAVVAVALVPHSWTSRSHVASTRGFSIQALFAAGNATKEHGDSSKGHGDSVEGDGGSKSLKEHIDGMKEDVGSLHSGSKSLKEHIDGLKEHVGSLHSGGKSLPEHVDGLEKHVGSLAEYLRSSHSGLEGLLVSLMGDGENSKRHGDSSEGHGDDSAGHGDSSASHNDGSKGVAKEQMGSLRNKNRDILRQFLRNSAGRLEELHVFSTEADDLAGHGDNSSTSHNDRSKEAGSRLTQHSEDSESHKGASESPGNVSESSPLEHDKGEVPFACRNGTVPCGGLCLYGAVDSVCCASSRGDAVLCGAGSECCDGVCEAPGTGCASDCGPGLISCGGICIVGTAEDSCCVGPGGRGVMCDAASACCDGVCAANGTGCDKTCSEGMVHCGGECLLGNAADTCCLGSSGKGILCDGEAECCDGVCLPNGQGCAKHCGEGMLQCGGECMVAASGDSCCLNAAGSGIICDGNSECCDGVCMAEGTGCAKTCAPGLLSCGGECLAGNSTDKCCLGEGGSGIICESTAECCDGVCMAEGTGCSKTCGLGLLSCGGECLAGDSADKCCLGEGGKGILCESTAECCDGVCMAEGTGCAKTCAPGLLPCGDECLAGNSTDKCCLGEGGTGILCESTAECCDGVCMAAGTGCAKTCGDGLVSCGGECIPGNMTNSKCCLGPSGKGVLCGLSDTCCGGLCEAPGSVCALEP